jgi:mono/diheme cytochrome c family protein
MASATRAKSRSERGWTLLSVACLVAAAAAAMPLAAVAQEATITPARGPSLVARLKTGVDWTAFGRAGEGSSASDALAPSSDRPAGDWLVNGFTLTGDDLFRINCRSCHGPDGKGARSGIPPLWGALEKPAPAPGQPGGEIAVRHRLVEGGRVMPNFAHLQSNEVELLLGHLRTLGHETAGDGKPATIHQSALRVGEHIVKATCQICHDATRGPARQPADTVVTTLADIPERYSVHEFVRKVRSGSTVEGDPHGRMPRFNYLKPEELEAAYIFLTAFPPQPE